MKSTNLIYQIEEASKVIGNTWPLYSFVTSNPLNDLQDLHFSEAVDKIKSLLDAKVYPSATMFRKAWDNGEIKKNELVPLLKEHGFNTTPTDCLEIMGCESILEIKNQNHQLDRIMVKWLSTFLDEGLAEWEMPGKDRGFYMAWRQLVPFDAESGKPSLASIPSLSEQALSQLTEGCTGEEIQSIFTHHLAALPGWAGYIKHRNLQPHAWQDAFPVHLQDYLAVRLWTAKLLQVDILPKTTKDKDNSEVQQLKYIWLKAWEKSWQKRLMQKLEKASTWTAKEANRESIPDAQFVFCIDTRSEMIRRHVESTGNYETFGYAGFFGVAMDYENPKDGLSHKSCPPILDSSYAVSESAQKNKNEQKRTLDAQIEKQRFWNYFLKRMKNMLPSSFGFVEGSGFFYGLQMFLKTMVPGAMYNMSKTNEASYESACEPHLENKGCNSSSELNISAEEKAMLVKSAFELMGWKQFAPLILFIGHGSHSANNPYGSSLDCGACAASPGRHNARLLAKLANEPEVRQILKDKFLIKIPERTYFVGGEHNTTTDQIVLFDFTIPNSHKQQISILRKDLRKIQETATQERLGINTGSIYRAQINASNWGETRPEWGLAKNASFIIAPRTTTQNLSLDGRSFLHSYDWKTDKEGKILETIMQGPMVVTQWINNHYYFSTVDNNTFGGGTKVTNNITGKFGVVQGNGGDLKIGLPWESLYTSKETPFHAPLRLSVVIQAPLDTVRAIINQNNNLKSLIDNEWIYIIVMDPVKNGVFYSYQKNLGWSSNSKKKVIPSKSKTKLGKNMPEKVLA